MPPAAPGVPAFVIITELVSYSYTLEDKFLPVLTITKGKTSYKDLPLADIFVSSVNYIDYDATTVVQKPTTPSLSSPLDGETILDLPFTLDWSASELTGIVQKEHDKALEDIIYTVQVSKDPTFVGLIDIEEETTETELIISQLEKGMTYYWRVSASLGEENSNWSEPWSFSIKENIVEIPDPPVLTAPIDEAEDIDLMPTFEWSAVDGIIRWRLIIAEDEMLETGVLVDDDEITESQFILDFDLEHDKTYYWAVAAFDGENWSDLSNIFSFSTLTDTYVDQLIYINTLNISPQPADEFIDISIYSSKTKKL
jgi:hypothetical protein